MKKIILILAVVFLAASSANSYAVNNYYIGAFVKSFPYSNPQKGNYEAVIQVVTVVNKNLFKSRSDNVLFVYDRSQMLRDAFVSFSWHEIDYFTNKPVSGELFITFDRRRRWIAAFVEFEIKKYHHRKKHRKASGSIEKFFKKEVVEEIELRLREEYNLK